MAALMNLVLAGTTFLLVFTLIEQSKKASDDPSERDSVKKMLMLLIFVILARKYILFEPSPINNSQTSEEIQEVVVEKENGCECECSAVNSRERNQ